MAGISFDSDSRLLRSVKINTRLGRIRPIEMPSFFNSMITETAYVQDPTHIGTKLRNKILQSSILLPMENKQVSIAHLKILIEKYPKSYHGLSYNDICPESRFVHEPRNDQAPGKYPGERRYYNVPKIVLECYICIHGSATVTSGESVDLNSINYKQSKSIQFAYLG